MESVRVIEVERVRVIEVEFVIVVEVVRVLSYIICVIEVEILFVYALVYYTCNRSKE